MACKKKKVELTEEVVNKVKEFFEKNPEKSWRAGQIAEKLNLDKEIVSAVIKKLKEEGVVAGRCAYKLAK